MELHLTFNFETEKEGIIFAIQEYFRDTTNRLHLNKFVQQAEKNEWEYDPILRHFVGINKVETEKEFLKMFNKAYEAYKSQDIKEDIPEIYEIINNYQEEAILDSDDIHKLKQAIEKLGKREKSFWRNHHILKHLEGIHDIYVETENKYIPKLFQQARTKLQFAYLAIHNRKDGDNPWCIIQ